MSPPPSDAHYVIFGPPISLFTRKLESAMRFYAAPLRREAKDAENGPSLEKRSGSRQVPVFETPENWILADTTPIMEMLDARYPARRMFPLGCEGVLVHIVEEVLDEWIARTMVHYRWHYPENTRAVVSELLGKPVSLEEAMEFPLAKWGPRACRATGTESEHQRRHVELEYMAIVDALESQLGETRYAMGDRATAVDTILLGGLRAHTNADPVPDLSAYKRIQSWDAHDADAWDGGGALPGFPSTTPFAEHILALARECYVPFVEANARALEAGQKAFEVDTYGETVSYLARPYPERSREMIRARICNQLDPEQRKQAGEFLEARGLAASFMPR